MLRATPHQDLKFFVGYQFLQVPVNRPKADRRQFLAHLIIDLIGGRMRLILLDGLPDDAQLFGISSLSVPSRHMFSSPDLRPAIFARRGPGLCEPCSWDDQSPTLLARHRQTPDELRCREGTARTAQR